MPSSAVRWPGLLWGCFGTAVTVTMSVVVMGRMPGDVVRDVGMLGVTIVMAWAVRDMVDVLCAWGLMGR